MNTLRILAVVVGLAPAHLLAQSSDVGTFDLPSGTEVGKALATLCAAEAQGATLGFAARESGRSLEYVLSRMQDPTDAALRSIYRALKLTVEDVYAHPLIGYHTMFYYRSKICFRERTELKIMPSIVFSAAKLLRCEQAFGREGSPALLSCVGQAVSAL